MKKFEEMTEDEKRAVYDETLDDIGVCCCYQIDPFEEMNGICPDCGRATCYGECVCGCNYSPVACETCGARPCDGSC